MTMQIVEKLTGRDLVALQTADIIKRHEARRAISMPPFDDGFKCPNCQFVIVKPTPEEQLELLTAPPEFKERQERILSINGTDGVVRTPNDTSGEPWEPTPEEKAALEQPHDPPALETATVPAEEQPVG